MRVNAYILAADPAWIEASVLSYYDMVQKIVVSYDGKAVSYAGTPLEDLEGCLARLRAVDRDRKMVYSPGHYGRAEHNPMENETHQRQCALDEAGKDADWVLQLDTDEVVVSTAILRSCLGEADSGGFAALEYPMRWLYQRAGKDRFLEISGRFWQPHPGFPGPIAVKAGTRLRHARQCDGRAFHVDYRPTRWARGTGAKADRCVKPREAIVHFSWVRSEEEMRRKLRGFSHSKDRDWTGEFNRWVRAGAHPWLTATLTPIRRRGEWKWLRPATARCHHVGRPPVPPPGGHLGERV